MHKLPKLPYGYDALEPYIDRATMQIHHDKHHGAYIENLNKFLAGQGKFEKMDVQELLRKLSDLPPDIRTKVRNNAGGHANHSLFWSVMAPSTGAGDRGPSGELLAGINKTFGSFESFVEKFSNAGLGRFGSGWVWLVIDPSAGSGHSLAVVDTANQDSPLMDNKIPILGLDVWEHAYYIQYKWQRAEYIKNWWNIVNWDQVEKYFNENK